MRNDVYRRLFIHWGQRIGLAGLALLCLGSISASAACFNTAHFSVEHEWPSAWAGALGETLEQVHARFFRQLGWLGARESAGAAPRLKWVCSQTQETLPKDDSPTRFSASYVTRTHGVYLIWAPTGSSESSAVPYAHEFQPVHQGDPDAVIALNEPYLLLRVSHEAAHQLSFDCGLQRRGVMYPLWVSEGLAMAFEAPTRDDGQFLGSNAFRQTRLLEVWRRQALRPLNEFVTITSCADMTSPERDDFYAQAWALFRFLGQQQPDAMRQYLQQVARLPWGVRSEDLLREEITAAFGPLDRLEPIWQAWLTRELEEVPLPHPGTAQCKKRAPAFTGAPRA